MELTIQCPLYRISYLLCSAFEGGSNYWYSINSDTPPPNGVDLSAFDGHWDTVYAHVHYPLCAGGSLTIKDMEDNNKTYTLSLKEIEHGLKVFAEKYPRHFGNWLSEDDDAITGDVFLQCCLFGEAKY